MKLFCFHSRNEMKQPDNRIAKKYLPFCMFSWPWKRSYSIKSLGTFRYLCVVSEYLYIYKKCGRRTVNSPLRGGVYRPASWAPWVAGSRGRAHLCTSPCRGTAQSIEPKVKQWTALISINLNYPRSTQQKIHRRIEI